MLAAVDLADVVSAYLLGVLFGGGIVLLWSKAR
jgi:hypothetical protein